MIYGAILKKKTFQTLSALAASIAVYDHNQKTILRASFKNNGVEFQANRLLIENYLEGQAVPFTVNKKHTEKAKEFSTYLQHTSMMRTLKQPRKDQFLSMVASLVANEEISSRDLGVLAWAPKLVEKYQQQDNVCQLSARFERQSNYIGSLNDKITVNFKLIESRYVPRMDCYAVYGYTLDENLIFYWAKGPDRVVENGEITGRVKEHKIDTYRNNARVTVLNYVKKVSK